MRLEPGMRILPGKHAPAGVELLLDKRREALEQPFADGLAVEADAELLVMVVVADFYPFLRRDFRRMIDDVDEQLPVARILRAAMSLYSSSRAS